MSGLARETKRFFDTAFNPTGSGIGSGGGSIATGPAPDQGSQEILKKQFREKVAADSTIDDEIRAEILASMDRGADPMEVQRKYAIARDAENPETRERTRRIAAGKVKRDTPGLSAQTILGSTPPPPSSILGGGQ